MQVLISGRHFEVNDIMRERITNRLTAMFEETTLKVSSARAVLSLEKSRCIADITVSIKNHEIIAKADGYDMYKVIDKAMDHIESQLGKYIDKFRNYHRTPALRDLEAAATEKI